MKEAKFIFIVSITLTSPIDNRQCVCLKSRKLSAKGAEYESQGQARSEAERVAPG
jgi:hypothetical protein